MGNNASNTRKSVSGSQHSGTRKSSVSAKAQQNLDEEFSDLILHEVKRSQAQQAGNNLVPVSSEATQTNSTSQNPERHPFDTYKRFSNDLIEDEFNEINDGVMDADHTEVTRNILPNDDSTFNESSDKDESMSSFSSSSIKRRSNNKDIHDIGDSEFRNIDFSKISAVPDRYPQVANREQSYMKGGSLVAQQKDSKSKLVPVEIKWVNSMKENISKISIIGSFSNWRDVIRLKPSNVHKNEYCTTINLPIGVHKLLYIVNNEYRVSDQLPTATDQEGIFFNWFEVIDEERLFNHSQHQHNHIGASSDYDANIITRAQVAGKYNVEHINDKSNSFLTKISKEEGNFEHIEYSQENTDESSQPPQAQYEEMQVDDASQTSRYVPYSHHLSTSFLNNQETAGSLYSSDIPEMFMNYEYFKKKGPDYELTEPPQLPAHLNNVLLNKISSNQQQGHLSNSVSTTSVSDVLKPSHSPFAQPSNAANKRPPLRRADSSYYASNKEAYHLAIPNHVILNHLMTTSIRNEVLTVACITRYSGKFVTQIMHSPADPPTKS